MAMNSLTFRVFGITTLLFISIVAIIDATESGEQDTLRNHDKCERLTMGYCNTLPYNMTMMPNFFGHKLQADAGLELMSMGPTFYMRSCKPHLRYYLCLLYAPICTSSGKLLLPCRSFCHDAQDDCKAFLWKELEYSWPDHLNCDELPDHEAFPDVDCVGNPKTLLPWSPPPPKSKAPMKTD